MIYQSDILSKKFMDDNLKEKIKQDIKIVKLFKGRCVRCQRPYNTIHECVPRSQGKAAMEEDNRVPICDKCHDWAHRVGTRVSAPILLKAREKRLEQYYGNNKEIIS